MTTPQPRQSRTSRWGVLVPTGIIVLGIAEIALLVVIGINTSLWWSVLIVVVGWVVGVALVVTAGQQSFVRLRSLVRAVRGSGDVKDHLSRPAFTLLAAALFFFPGLISDVLGVILLLTPVQRRAVRSAGLSSGSEAARKVIYRRDASGVIQGEIVIDAQHSAPKQDGSGRTPPTISQD